MQKVLIISYFFPPCPLTGANRVGSWLKYLPQHGVYPIVLTRNWDGSEIEESDRLKDSGTSVRHLVNSDSEIYYTPYKSILRDKIFIKGDKNRFFKILSKALTFIGLILQNLSIQCIAYRNMYSLARVLLKENKDIRTLVVSANPFEQFFMGYLLKKEFKDLEWIADYRDDWTTNPLYNISLNSRLFKRYNQLFEKKWIANASKVTTVTELYKSRLSKLHQRECLLLMNGYNEELNDIKAIKNSDIFQITYSGTIYPHQDFTSLISILQQIAVEEPIKRVKLTFLGSRYFTTAKQKELLSSSTKENFEIELTDRVSWKKGIAFAKGSDVLLIGSYGDLKGVIPSKIFEYIAMDVPIVCYPSDRDIIDEILKKTGTALICNSETACYEAFKSIIKDNYSYNPNRNEIIKFSANKQVSNLAKILME